MYKAILAMTITLFTVATFAQGTAFVPLELRNDTLRVTVNTGMRSCASLECEVTQRVRSGQNITVVGYVFGEEVEGDNLWYVVEWGVFNVRRHHIHRLETDDLAFEAVVRGIVPNRDGVYVPQTATPTPSNTATATSTATSASSPTSLATNTPAITPTFTPEAVNGVAVDFSAGETLYYANGAANLRPCPELNNLCAPVGSLVFNDEITVLGVAVGAEYAGSRVWYYFQRDEEDLFVHSAFMSDVPLPTAVPFVPTRVPSTSGNSAGGSTGGSSSSSGGTSGGSSFGGGVPGASDVCYQVGFDFGVCPQYAPSPRNCDEVVARGIPERVAACCFPGRDADKDGVACYGS